MADIEKTQSGEDYKTTRRATVKTQLLSQSVDVYGGPEEGVEEPRVGEDWETGPSGS